MSTGALAEDTFPLPEPPSVGGAFDRHARLPAAITPLIGTDLEIEQLSAMVRDERIRLITLTGLGGVGKTRLAVETASRVAGEFAQGTTFVSLAAVQDPHLVGPTIAQALDVQTGSGLPAVELLQSTLHDNHMLLVLDNFEHLTPAATIVTDLLTACPRVKVLNTSRFKLNLTGEHEVQVQPLETADPARLPGVDELIEIPA